MPDKDEAEAEAKVDMLDWDASRPFLYEQLYQLLDDFADALQGKGQLVADLLPDISLEGSAKKLESLAGELKNIKQERVQRKKDRQGRRSRFEYYSEKPFYKKKLKELQREIFTRIFAIARHPDTENKRQALIQAFIEERNDLLRNDETPDKEADWDQVQKWVETTEEKLIKLIESRAYLKSWAITRKGFKGLEQLAWDMDSLAMVRNLERPEKVKQLLLRVFAGYKNSLQARMGSEIVHASIQPDFIGVRLLRIFDRLTEYLITANLGYKQLHLLKNSLQIRIGQSDRFKRKLKDGSEIEGNAYTDDRVPRPGSGGAHPVVIRFNSTFYSGDEQTDRADRRLIFEHQSKALNGMKIKFLPPALAHLLADPFAYVPIHEFGHFRNWLFDEKVHSRKDNDRLKAVGKYAAEWGSKEKIADAFVLSQYDTGQQVDPYTKQAISPEHVRVVEKAVGKLRRKSAGQRWLQHYAIHGYDPDLKQHPDGSNPNRFSLQPIGKLQAIGSSLAGS